MGMNPLPFPRGTTMDPSASAKIQNLLGQVFVTDDPLNGGTIELQVVKNTDASVLAPKQTVVFETATSYAVDKTGAEAAPDVAGIVDQAYESSASFPGSANPAVNAYLWVVKKGRVEALTPATTAAHNACTLGDRVMMAGTDDGAMTGIGAASATTTYLDNMHFSFGHSLETVSAAQVSDSVVISIDCQR